MADMPFEEMLQVLRAEVALHREAAAGWTKLLRSRKTAKQWQNEDEHQAAAIEQAIKLLEDMRKTAGPPGQTKAV